MRTTSAVGCSARLLFNQLLQLLGTAVATNLPRRLLAV
jgi:hypothetical protein